MDHEGSQHNEMRKCTPWLLRHSSTEYVPSPFAGDKARVSDCRVGKIYVFGGKDTKGNLLDDLWWIDSRDLSWGREYPKGAGPSPRWLHSGSFVDGIFFVYGGIGEDGEMLNDLYGLDVSTLTWKIYDTGNPPPEARATHTAMAFKNFKFFLCGGGSTSMLDVFQSEPFIADKRALLKRNGDDNSPTLSTADLLSMKGSAGALPAPTPSAIPAAEPSPSLGSITRTRKGSKIRTSSLSGPPGSSAIVEDKSPRRKLGGSRLSESVGASSAAVSAPVAARKSSMAPAAPTGKTSTKQLEEHLEHLEEFSSHLSDEVNQFIQMIESFMSNPDADSQEQPADGEEDGAPSLKEKISAKGASLMMYAVTNKPASIVTAAGPQKEKEERYPIPSKYFEQLQLPDPRKRTADDIGGMLAPLCHRLHKLTADKVALPISWVWTRT